MKGHLAKRLPALLLALCLLCSGCGGPGAAAMRLARTEGAVEVKDPQGKALQPKDGLKLYSGYGMSTGEKSYAWIELDQVKLAKMDAESMVRVEKEEKALRLAVDSGSVFFNVSQPLAEDESMQISSSTMTVGIRGTCGWVTAQSARSGLVGILEGSVEVTLAADGQTVTVTAGQMAQVTQDEAGSAQVVVVPFPPEAVPAFVQQELQQDETLAGAVEEASGLALQGASTAALPQPVQEAYGRVIAEYRQLAEQGIGGLDWPELDGFDWGGYRYVRANSDLFYYGHTVSAYAYRDLDQNGTSELLIGYYNGQELAVGAIYAFDGTDAVNILPYDLFVLALSDGLILETSPAGVVETVCQIGPDGYTLQPVAGSGVVTSTGENWQAAGIDQDLSAHGGTVDSQLAWLPIGGGPGEAFAAPGGSDGPGSSAPLDPADYLGSYANGAQQTFSINESFGRFSLNRPRPGDPAHLDTYDLQVAGGSLQVVFWENDEPVLILTPQEGGMMVEYMGGDENLAPLDGWFDKQP